LAVLMLHTTVRDQDVLRVVEVMLQSPLKRCWDRYKAQLAVAPKAQGHMEGAKAGVDQAQRAHMLKINTAGATKMGVAMPKTGDIRPHDVQTAHCSVKP